MSDAEIPKHRSQQTLSAVAQANATPENESTSRYQEAERHDKTAQTHRDSEERLRLLIENTQVCAIFMLDVEGYVISWNKGAERIKGYTDKEILNQHFSIFYHSKDVANGKPEMMLEQALRNGRYEEEGWNVRKDGTSYWASIIVTALRSKSGDLLGFGKVIHDISERQQQESVLQFQATHDELTGLPNRYLFTDRMQQAISYGRRHGKRFVVAFIDLDRFKWVNDNLGHESGDELLRIVAQRISSCLRETDTVARIGGDEFLLLLQGTRNTNEATIVITRVMSAICKPIQLRNHEVTVSCSIGCSAFPDDSEDAETLLRFADTAMYCAKESGRNNVQIYNTELRQRIDVRLRLEHDLRHAIDRNQLTLHYQIQVEMHTGAIRGVEAQLRWNHPDAGQLLPSEFVPIAEQMGMIDMIGQWVMHQACLQNKAWQDAGIDPIRITINLSAKQLTAPGFEQLVTDCLAASGLASEYLELTLTENASMSDPARMIPLLQKLKALGISITIDNFGTSYSNMQYLTNLPIDCLKLDGSFVQHITSDPARLAIAEAIIVMAHRLGLKTVGEMVETEGQILRLAESGCDYIQGHYFGPAIPADECATLLRKGTLPLPKPPVNHNRTLLILDDEPLVIAALKRALHKEDYDVISAFSVGEAFEHLAQHRIDVVLADLTLPDSDGIEFLNKVRRMYPEVIRLVLTARRDFEAATDAINRGSVHRFLTKPWENDELRDVLADAFERCNERP